MRTKFYAKWRRPTVWLGWVIIQQLWSPGLATGPATDHMFTGLCMYTCYMTIMWSLEFHNRCTPQWDRVHNFMSGSYTHEIFMNSSWCVYLTYSWAKILKMYINHLMSSSWKFVNTVKFIKSSCTAHGNLQEYFLNVSWAILVHNKFLYSSWARIYKF